MEAKTIKDFPVTDDRSRRMSKGLKALFIVGLTALAFIAGLGTGYVGGRIMDKTKKEEKSNLAQTTVAPTPTDTLSPTPTAPPTTTATLTPTPPAGFRTYTDNDLGIQFFYPGTATVTRATTGGKTSKLTIARGTISAVITKAVTTQVIPTAITVPKTSTTLLLDNNEMVAKVRLADNTGYIYYGIDNEDQVKISGKANPYFPVTTVNDEYLRVEIKARPITSDITSYESLIKSITKNNS